MASDVSEGSIAYDEQFEEDEYAGVAPTAQSKASVSAAAESTGKSAAAAPLTDVELDEYLNAVEPGQTAVVSSSKGAAATVRSSQPVMLQPDAVAADPPSYSIGTGSTSHVEETLQESSSRRLDLSGQASRNSVQLLSQQPSRQLSSDGSNQNLKPLSRRASRNNSSRRSGHSSDCAPAAAEPVEANKHVKQMQQSANHEGDSVQQQDSVDEVVADLDDSCAGAAAENSAGGAVAIPAVPCTPFTGPTARTAGAAATAVDASWLSPPHVAAVSPKQAAAPAAVASTAEWWDNEQHQHQQQQQEQVPLSRVASHRRHPSSAAAAAAAFSLNSAAAAASIAAGAAAYDAVHVVPHKPGRHQRPASASAGQGSGRRDWQQQEQPAPSNGWHADVQEQVQTPLAVLPLEQWEVSDVCEWVEGIGLPQYRKKFMHHCIGGRLLLRLTDQLLRKELGIGPLGHRALLLDAITACSTADLAAAAAAAAAGTPAAEFAPAGMAPGAATALLVAGCVAVAAADSQQFPHRRRVRGVSAGSAEAVPSSNAHAQHQDGAGPNPAGSHSYSAAAGWEAEALAGNGCSDWAGSGRRSPAASPGGRPSSAPAGRGRRSQSPSPVATRPGALGPAAGRTSVHEQRSKLLYELGRAQERAAAQSSCAAQVGDVARLAAEEVARLQGQLADLDSKNRLQVDHAAGSVDSRGHIPWQHVGAGTHAGHPRPESHARPWDPPDADLTFSPKISARSQQLMAESRGQGGGRGFLARLGNDLKRRQVKMKELERRHNTFGGGGASAADAAGATKAAAADLSLLLGFFRERGWADLSGPGSGDGQGAGAHQEQLDEQLDEVVDAHSKELSVGDVQLRSILAARGHKKVAALAAVVRTQQFMDRYKADLSTRDSRLSELQGRWFKQQLQGSPAASGPTGHAPAAALTAEQRDMQQALLWFSKLGWDVQEAEDDCEDQLAALIKRARAYKTEVEKLHDKTAAAAATGVQQAAAAGAPQINWQSMPWKADGLNDLMQTVLDAQKAAAEGAAAKAAAASKPSARDAALKAAGSPKLGSAASSTQGAAGHANAAAGSARQNPLGHAVQLLAGMRWAGLDQLDAAAGLAKKLAVYRALRTQQFLEFTAADLASREAKQRALWAAYEDSRRGKVVSKAELDEFYARLQADGDRRTAELAKARADKQDRETRALALVSVGAGRSTRSSARSRPQSAK